METTDSIRNASRRKHVLSLLLSGGDDIISYLIISITSVYSG